MISQVPDARLKCFIQLVGREAQTGRIEQAFKLARAMPGDLLRARAIASMAPHLPETALTRALELANSVEEPAARACVLAGLAPYLSDVERTQAFSDALAATRGVTSVADRAEALERVIEALQTLAPLVENGVFERTQANALLLQADKIRLDLRDAAIRADLRAQVVVCAARLGSPRTAPCFRAGHRPARTSGPRAGDAHADAARRIARRPARRGGKGASSGPRARTRRAGAGGRYTST